MLASFKLKHLIIIQILMWGWLCCRGSEVIEQSRTSKKMPIEKARLNKKQSQPGSLQKSQRIIQPNKSQQNSKTNIEQKVEKKDVYVGQQLNGVPHGTGTMQYVNGDYYKGEWVNGQKQGKGEHYYLELRTTYRGQWKHDLKNGNGHQTQANQSWFEGQFKDGVRHGKGMYFDKQLNQKYSEIYMNGRLKQRKQIAGHAPTIEADQFPTLKLDKQRFNTDDLTGFQQRNPQIKQLDLDFLLKYYGLKKVISLDFIDIPINEWTIKQVHTFLEEINLQQYKTIFYDNKIKGKDLATLDQDEMKQDLKMKLGDRKILLNYIEYLNSINKSKKKNSKSENKKIISKRRGSLSVKKKKESLLNSITQSIQNQIIQEDDQWNQPQSPSDRANSGKEQKKKTQYETQKWDKYMSRDEDIAALAYRSQAEMLIPNEDQKSDKTERGSNEEHDRQIEMSPVRRKKSEDKQHPAGLSSLGGNNNQNGLNKKQKQSSSSQSSQPQGSENDDETLKIKRKKTSLVTGPSQQIRQLYQFLKQNQSLDFIIKQKDIEILEEIGQGGYGKVSKGRYMQCPVAVKDYMKAGRSHKSRQQFMKQVHVLSDLKHPNIVLYMGLCITVNRYQLVTQYMENGSLYDQIHIKKTKFTKEQQFEIIDDIVQGMVYLHNMKNMLHRDLKSSNVLIAEDYKVKLCDFGLSGHKNKNKKTKKNRIGTYQWMAPEVIRNQELDFFSDVYSFGVILWEILTEQIPYYGMSETQIIGDVGYDKNHRLPKPPKGSDEFIISIMDKCLQRDPSSRPTFIMIQQMIKQERTNRPIVKDVWNIL